MKDYKNITFFTKMYKTLLFLFKYAKIKNNGGYDDEKINNWNIYFYCIYFYVYM